MLPESTSRKKHRGRVFIADETHLNKGKPSIISKHGRPQCDQIKSGFGGPSWKEMWEPIFLFRVLDHFDDAYDGRPRGYIEMLRNIKSLGNKQHDTFACNKWKSTASAFKAFRDANGLSESDLPHEIVNHSLGELANENGFSTNAIEAKWSSSSVAFVPRWQTNCLRILIAKSGDH